jgi:hypothetical protein
MRSWTRDDLLARREARRMGARAAEVIAAGHTWGHNARRVAALAASIGRREAVCA